MKTVLHTITRLHTGGAETMLAKLIEADLDLRPVVLSLLQPGVVAGRIRSQNVSVRSLGMREGVPSLVAFAQLIREARRVRPDLVQGWMHHGNLAATCASWAAPHRPPVVWNIRHSLVALAHQKPLTRAVLRLGAGLSRTTAAVVYNAKVSAHQYETFGFDPGRTVVIPNGFDCEHFRPRPEARSLLSQKFGIDERVQTIGMVARYHPMKDVDNLVEAARRVRASGLDAHLLVVGRGFDQAPPEVETTARAALPPDRLTLAGESHDVARWLSGLDVFVLPSAWGEGFPNILGEATACGVPCVATDVGDSAWIIGPCGSVVPPRDPEALARALARMLELDPEQRRQLGQAARARTIELFSLHRVAQQYEALYERVLYRQARSRETGGSLDATRGGIG
jgi:glycosyltransferase involved in cell wall biosynthesis